MGGMAGDLETARSAARKLLAANPEFTIRRYLAIPRFRTCPSTTNGWRKGCETPGCQKAEK